MNLTSELYYWHPADKRLAELIYKGKTVIVRQENDIFAVSPNSLLTAIGVEMILKRITDCKWEYLPPTIPEVLAMPDSEGWWWVWDDNRKNWDRRYVEMKDGKPYSIGIPIRKSYCIKIQKPNFNPKTGETL